jgi:hypothetical protein
MFARRKRIHSGGWLQYSHSGTVCVDLSVGALALWDTATVSTGHGIGRMARKTLSGLQYAVCSAAMRPRAPFVIEFAIDSHARRPERTEVLEGVAAPTLSNLKARRAERGATVDLQATHVTESEANEKRA